MFKLKRLWFVLTLPRKQRRRYCLTHFVENEYDGCPECRDADRVERRAVEQRMAYYNMALRDRDMAEVLLAEGGLPIVDHRGLLGGQVARAIEPADAMFQHAQAVQINAAMDEVVAGDFMPEAEDQIQLPPIPELRRR